MVHSLITSVLRRSLMIALCFQIAWIITGMLFSMSGVEVRWSLLIGNALTLWLPALIIFFTNLSLSDKFQINFAIFITASSLVGSALDGYGLIANWDTMVHVYSGVLFVWLGFIIGAKVEASIKKPLPLWFKNSTAFMVTMTIAALWEIYEYTSDTYLGTSMQAGGLTDTIVDMSAAFVGALIALVATNMWLILHKNRHA